MAQALTEAARGLFPADAQPRFIDPAQETVQIASKILKQHQLLNSRDARPAHTFVTSADPALFAAQVSSWLDIDSPLTSHADLDIATPVSAVSSAA
jgi:glutamate racemase